MPSEPRGDLTKPSCGRAAQLLYPSAQTCWNDATRLHPFSIQLSLTSGRVKDVWSRMQTINTCNFNTVQEAYLNNCDFTHTGDFGHDSSVHGISVFRAEGFPLFSTLEPGKKSDFLRESLCAVASTLLCSRRAEVTPGDSASSSRSTFHSRRPGTTAGTWGLTRVSPIAAGYCPDRKAVINTAVCTSHVNFLKHYQKYSIRKTSALSLSFELQLPFQEARVFLKNEFIPHLL